MYGCKRIWGTTIQHNSSKGIAVLHFRVTVGYSTMSKTYTLKMYFFFKYEDEIFSFKLQHNFRIYYRFDFTKNKELCINYDFKDLIYFVIWNKFMCKWHTCTINEILKSVWCQIRHFIIFRDCCFTVLRLYSLK
jgi:hypothetical protein